MKTTTPLSEQFNEKLIETIKMRIAQNESIINLTNRTSIPYYKGIKNDVKVKDLERDIEYRKKEIEKMKKQLTAYEK